MARRRPARAAAQRGATGPYRQARTSLRAPVPRGAQATTMSPSKNHRARQKTPGNGAAISATQPQPPDQRFVPGDVLALEIIEQAAAVADHDEQAAPRMEVLL